jgi:DNA repair protein RecO (recombination protein O)
MGLLHSEAVILQTFPLSELDRIVVIYTRSYGKLRGVASGAKRLQGRFSGRTEPFHWVQVHAHEKESRELVKIDKIELVQAFGCGLSDYRSFLRLSVVAELLLKTVPEREPNEPLFRLLLLVLPEIRNVIHADLAQLYFEIWHLKLAGLFPTVCSCSDCGKDLRVFPRIFYSLLSCGFCCPDCKRGSARLLSSEGYRLLRAISQKALKEILAVHSNWVAVGELSQLIEELLESNFERHLDSLRLIHDQS